MIMAVQKVSADKFDETIREGIWIADFYTDHCGPCKVLSNTIDQVIFDNPMVNLAKCNVEDEPAYIKRFGVRGTPTLIFFNNGQETGRFCGALDRDKVEEYLSQCMYG